MFIGYPEEVVVLVFFVPKSRYLIDNSIENVLDDT